PTRPSTCSGSPFEARGALGALPPGRRGADCAELRAQSSFYVGRGAGLRWGGPASHSRFHALGDRALEVARAIAGPELEGVAAARQLDGEAPRRRALRLQEHRLAAGAAAAGADEAALLARLARDRDLHARDRAAAPGVARAAAQLELVLLHARAREPGDRR